MKKIVSAILLTVMLLTIFAPAFAEDYDVQPSAGSGESFVTMDTTPFVEKGRTYLPVRFVAEPFGIRTLWNASTRTITLDRGGITVRLVIGSKTMTVSEGSASSTVLMDVAPLLRNGRTFLPVRYVADAFGFTTTWFPDRQGIKISEGAKSLNFKIGSKELMVIFGHFLKLIEWNEFRFACPANAVLSEKTASAIVYRYKEFHTNAERAIVMTLTPAAGTSFENMSLDNVASYLATSYLTVVTTNPTTFNGIPAINYAIDLLNGGAVYGIAFFRGSNLVRMEVVIPEGNYYELESAKGLFAELRRSFALK